MEWLLRRYSRTVWRRLGSRALTDPARELVSGCRTGSPDWKNFVAMSRTRSWRSGAKTTSNRCAYAFSIFAMAVLGSLVLEVAAGLPRVCESDQVILKSVPRLAVLDASGSCCGSAARGRSNRGKMFRPSPWHFNWELAGSGRNPSGSQRALLKNRREPGE